MSLAISPRRLRVARERGLVQDAPKIRIPARHVSPLGRHVRANEAERTVVERQPHQHGPLVAHDTHHAHPRRCRLTRCPTTEGYATITAANRIC